MTLRNRWTRWALLVLLLPPTGATFARSSSTIFRLKGNTTISEGEC